MSSKGTDIMLMYYVSAEIHSIHSLTWCPLVCSVPGYFFQRFNPIRSIPLCLWCSTNG